MTMRTRHAVFAAVALLLLGAAPADAQKKGGELVFLQQSTPRTLDAITSTEQAVRNVAMNIYEMLVTRDEGSNPIPDLAAKVDESPDGLTYTFALRQGVKFHNGKEMTAEDAKASVERYGRIGFDRADFTKIKAVAAPDKYTLTITLSERVPSFIEQLSSPRAPMVILPAEEAAKEANKINPIGTGPFQLVEYVPDSHVKMKRFEDYKANEGAGERNGFSGRKIAYVDTVVFRIVPEANTRVAMLETRGAHFSEQIPSQTANRLKGSKDIQVVTLMPWSMAFAILNAGPGGGATSKLGVRRAIQAALDVDEIMAIATDGVYRLDHAFNYPESQYFSETVGKAVYNQANPAKAKQLLAEAGYAGEEIIVITTSQIAIVKAQAELTTEQLKAAGMKARVVVYDTPAYIAKAGQPDGWNIYIGEFGLAPSIGPYGLPNFWTGPKNWQKQADPVLDAAFNDLKTKTTLAERKAAVDRFYAQLADQAFAVKLGDNGLLQAVRSEVKNFKPYRVPRAWGVWLE